MPRLIIALALLGAAIGPLPLAVPPALAQCAFTPGAVVRLQGTPHLFIADDQGVLHWGGDTRGLVGRFIDWNNRCDVGLDTLRAARRGDPWLSAGLPKIGDPIYLAKWEDTEPAPRLLHIQTIADVELFGITTANYGNFIMERPVWEARFGFSVGSLQVGPLASAASFAWSAADQAAYALLLTNSENVQSAALFRATQGGIDAAVILPALADCEYLGLVEFDRTRNAGRALGVTQDCINRLGTGPTPGAPRTPTNVRVTVLGPTQLRVSWDDVADETGFRIYGGDQFVPPTTLVATTSANQTSYDITGRSPGTAYCYTVTAFNAVAESAASTSACATTTPSTGVPTAPTNLRLTPVTNGMRLDWNDLSTTEDGFRILRSEQVIATVNPNVTTYTDFDPNRSPQACYRVVAFNANGQSSSDQVCPDASTTAPLAPKDLRLTPVGTGAGMRLDWTDAATNETGYQVYRGDQLLATLAANTTTYTDTTWTAGMTACYRVIAFNSSGQGTSDPVCPGSTGAPAAPTNLRLTTVTGGIRLEWNDNSTNEEGFRVQRNNQVLVTVGANQTSHIDTGYTPGTLTCYLVTAYNASGQASSNQACSVP